MEKSSEKETHSEGRDIGEAFDRLERVLQMASKTAHKLAEMVRCDGCSLRLDNSKRKAWRTLNCEHILCTDCAGRAKRDGKCNVPGCNIPVQPVDVVEDFVSGQIVDACVKLGDWAREEEGVKRLLF